MPPTLESLGIDRLSVEDRIALAQAIWDSVAAAPPTPLLTDPQRCELERRLADHAAHPDMGTGEGRRARPVRAVSLPVVFRRAARAGLDADFYEGRAPGLGRRFTLAVERVIDRAAAQPDFYPLVLDRNAGARARQTASGEPAASLRSKSTP